MRYIYCTAFRIIHHWMISRRSKESPSAILRLPHRSHGQVENSGLAQGPFLKRQKVMRQDGMAYLGPDDLKVGQEITIYGRTIHINGCDRFTRWFFEHLGLLPQVPIHGLGLMMFSVLVQKERLLSGARHVECMGLEKRRKVKTPRYLTRKTWKTHGFLWISQAFPWITPDVHTSGRMASGFLLKNRSSRTSGRSPTS